MFDDANEYVFIDDTPLTCTTKKLILSCIVGIFYVVAHGNFADVKNPAFGLGLFRPRHAPNSHFGTNSNLI